VNIFYNLVCTNAQQITQVCRYKIVYIQHCMLLCGHMTCFSQYKYLHLINIVITRACDWLKQYMNIQFVIWGFRFMVFNATFNNISVIWWRSALLVEETGVGNKTCVIWHWSVRLVATIQEVNVVTVVIM
jgi:hypothetical protein